MSFDGVEQALTTPKLLGASFGDDNAELGQLRPYNVDQLAALTYQQVPAPVQHQGGLRVR